MRSGGVGPIRDLQQTEGFCRKRTKRAADRHAHRETRRARESGAVFHFPDS
jgi:hypothetical protein